MVHYQKHDNYALKLWEFPYTESRRDPPVTVATLTDLLTKINGVRWRYHLPELTYTTRRPGNNSGPLFRLFCGDQPISQEVNSKPHLYALLDLYYMWLIKRDDALASMSEKD